jgi:hypothetical protein
VTSTGADPDTLIAPLRLLQSLRSTGSAHLHSKDWQAHLTRAGLEQLAPDEQFSEVLRRTVQALDGLAEHADNQLATGTP